MWFFFVFTRFTRKPCTSDMSLRLCGFEQMNAFSHTPPDLQPVASGWGRAEFTAPARGSCVSVPWALRWHCIHISPDEDGPTAMPEELPPLSRHEVRPPSYCLLGHTCVPKFNVIGIVQKILGTKQGYRCCPNPSPWRRKGRAHSLGWWRGNDPSSSPPVL